MRPGNVGALLVAGTTSDAGKSLVTTGLCRAFARRGVKVAPFKAQNMSNNSMVCNAPDGAGAEIGRAQWIQALAALAEPEAAMNPVLLKPGSDRRSHVVVMGRPSGEVDASDFVDGRKRLALAAYDAFDDLSSRYDVVVAEGAGSPAEINLRASDYVNMGLARHASMPTVVVGDIDRGGVFAAMYGTVALLSPEDQALVAGFVVNKFRGDASLLEPGLDELVVAHRTPGLRRAALAPRRVARLRGRAGPRGTAYSGGRPEGGGGPAAADQQLHRRRRPRPGAGPGRRLRVRPRVPSRTPTSWCCRGHGRRSVTWPGCGRAGLDTAVLAHAAAGKPVLGICGGCQLLGRTIDDPDGVEGSIGARADGLGLLDLTTTFGAEKVLRVHEPAGYEIHHGRVTGTSVPGLYFGTMVHGTLEDDADRAPYLLEALGVTSQASFTEARERRLDLLGDLVEEHLDVDALLEPGDRRGARRRSPCCRPGDRR